ncbi:MAG: RyR domain-containing protein [Hyphomonas sp.]
MGGHSKGRRGISWQLTAGVLLGFVTLGLGLWGWHDDHKTFRDALYRSLAAFHVSEFYGGSDPLNVQLEIARFTGIGAVVLTAVGTFLSFLSEGYARFKARVLRPDVVVVGSHEIAYAAVQYVEKKRKRNVTHIGAAAFHRRTRSTSLPWGNAARKDLMIATHIVGARHVLVVEQDESEALHLARLINEADTSANISAIVRDSRLADDAALSWADHNFRIITSSALSVRALHRKHPPFLTAIDQKHSRIHAVIVGFGHMGEAVARDICINCLTTGLDRPRITVIDPEVMARKAALKLRVPELEEICDFVACAGAFGGGQQPPDSLEADAPPISCVYVCLPDDHGALAALGGMAAWLREQRAEKAPVYIRLRDKQRLPNEGGVLHVFGDHQALLAESDFCGEGVDRLAKTYHEAYLNSRPSASAAQSGAPAASEALADWERLKETYRISNRLVVEHLPAKIASAGISRSRWLDCEDVPDFSDDPVDLTSDAVLLERIAELEHERFNAERRWNGWRFAEVRNNDRLEHNCLVPFDALEEATRNYDREFVRNTEDILNRRKRVSRAD